MSRQFLEKIEDFWSIFPGDQDHLGSVFTPQDGLHKVKGMEGLSYLIPAWFHRPIQEGKGLFFFLKRRRGSRLGPGLIGTFKRKRLGRGGGGGRAAAGATTC